MRRKLKTKKQPEQQGSFTRVEENIWILREALYQRCEEYLPGYYFHDEVQDMHGPFATLEEAHACSARYLESMG